jgi:hypothetical protein
MRLAQLAIAWSFVGCATEVKKPLIEDTRPTVTSVEVAELEISSSGLDRFVSCPPPGELGQRWIPPIPSWDSGSVSFAISTNSKDATASLEAPPSPVNPDQEAEYSRTERAIQRTRADFRRCYHKGLLYDPTQDGHVAIVLRLAKDGRVAKTEHFAACELASETTLCMRESAQALRFDPPRPGSDTVVVPVVFSGAQGPARREPGRNDPWAAEAFIAVETGRASFHACEEANRRAGKSVFATATFALDVDRSGRVTHAHIDPWTGDQDLLKCTAEAMQKLVFAPPPAGQGKVHARIAYNPRPGTK